MSYITPHEMRAYIGLDWQAVAGHWSSVCCVLDPATHTVIDVTGLDYEPSRYAPVDWDRQADEPSLIPCVTNTPDFLVRTPH